jgi:hypothetical protein
MIPTFDEQERLRANFGATFQRNESSDVVVNWSFVICRSSVGATVLYTGEKKYGESVNSRRPMP